MRRWGDGARFLERIRGIRVAEPGAVFRSNFIVGYPGETEEDHDELLHFVEEVRLDWCGFFAFSPEEGTHALTLPDRVPTSLMNERLLELRELQESITVAARDDLVGSGVRVLVDAPGIARSYREAPEIDGIIHVDLALVPGEFHDVSITGSLGTELIAAGAAPVEE